MSRIESRSVVLCVWLTLIVLAAYANHFQNDFHFDDFHTVSSNPYIRSLRYIPRFFVDPLLFSTLPDHATYRPIISTSLAIDYWLGYGRSRALARFPFHFSTFVWFIVQLILMFFLFRRIMDAADPHPSNIWTAVLATACYGLHPANAETVNYIIQRADLYSTLGIVASIVWYAAYPEQRKYGWYLLPAVAAFLSKAPALIYPVILLAYVWLFEGHGEPRRDAAGIGRNVIRATLPAFLVTIAGTIFTAKMTPAAYNPGGTSPALYRLTQPRIALHYFKTFFLPTELSADTDWGYVSGPFGLDAWAGYLFVIGLLAVAFYTARRREMRPIAFGIFWFFLAVLPTSMLPLAEVTNDHRMFFPFVGLALSVFWSLRLLLFRKTAQLTLHHSWVRGAVAALVVAMTAEAAGTHHRNIVWKTETSLWHDVTIKSPKNGRGWMNYGITFMPRDYPTALNYLLRAESLYPNYYYGQLNLGICYGGMGRDKEAEAHYQRAIALSPLSAEPYIYYAFWLKSRLRVPEARQQLEAAVRVYPGAIAARHILIQMYFQENKFAELRQMIQETLKLDPRDEVAARYQGLQPGSQNASAADAFSAEGNIGGLPPALQELLGGVKEPAKAAASSPPGTTPEQLLNLSYGYCKGGNYEMCLGLAKQAIEKRPLWAEAYNNAAAAYLAMQRWDEGIQAATQALQIKPDFQDARDNLQYGVTHRQQAVGEGK